MTRRTRPKPLPAVVEIPREFLESMPGLGEEVLRAGLYLWLREATVPELRAPATLGQIAQGTGLSRERIEFGMQHLLARNWVIVSHDGRYSWRYPTFPVPDAGEKGGEAHENSPRAAHEAACP